ncbi:polysaccharide deacetylase family protein [Natronococcus sp. A-GB1]|uniref:polysaccharide deacetylase family protein n=1 Tax=Natronococcus sp. A-GB1 TaxID=3037648 RepID=UPI00241C773B|nr:polysaccharide deacetylase family protein [Natronococcus sp. A-GB1]MDG5758033.1 polysaccharide deacetylase family protein [Natronococcus sp. A-GB1]
MRRRNLLAVAGVTAAGGAATAYGVSQRDTDEDGDSDDGRNESDGDGDGESADEEADDERADDLEERLEGSEGMLVFTYDDSPIEDYTFTYQVHQEYEVPGCLAVCPGLMEQDSDAYLEPDQLVEIYEAGWTVMSHTYEHRALGHTPLTEAADEGDDRVSVEWGRHGEFESDPLVVFDDDGAYNTTSVAGGGTDSTDAYVDLEEPLTETVSADGYLRHPEEFIQDILDRTDDRLAEWGIDVTGFVYTYDRYHGVVEEIVRDQYDAVANHRYGGGHNEIDDLDPTTMQRMYIETDKTSEEEIDEFMQTAADERVLSIVGAHSQFETFTEERLEYTIEAALENDLAIVTLDEALAELGYL